MKQPEQHRVEIKSKRAHPRDFFRTEWAVVCSCGFFSRWYDSYRAAENDGDEHVRLLSKD